MCVSSPHVSLRLTWRLQIPLTQSAARMPYVPDYSPVDDSYLASAAIVLLPIILLFVMIFTTRTLYAAWSALIILIIIAACA